jgi:GntR family transcriptional repressor for pyruvate dehydrogenase complex
MPPSVSVTAIDRPPSLVEKVRTQLADLLRGDATGREVWLPAERELAQRLCVSRSVVREATKRLETQGLVEIQHGIGIRAVDRLHRPLNDSLSMLIPDESNRMQALIEARLSIEPDAAAFAAERATRAQLDGLARVQKQLETAPDNEASVDADGAFHRCIAEASGNLIYRLVLDSLADLGKAGRLRSISRVGKDPAIQQHAGILAAIHARNSKLARTRMREHILAAVVDMGLRKRHTKRTAKL